MHRMLLAQSGRITKEFYARLRTKLELFRLFREERHATNNKQYATDAKHRAARLEKSKAWREAHKMTTSTIDVIESIGGFLVSKVLGRG